MAKYCCKIGLTHLSVIYSWGGGSEIRSKLYANVAYSYFTTDNTTIFYAFLTLQFIARSSRPIGSACNI
jgi:hypothetical protein